jgi:hypothetical protein
MFCNLKYYVSKTAERGITRTGDVSVNEILGNFDPRTIISYLPRADSQKSSRMTSTSRRSFGINESALDPNNNTPSSLPGSEQRRILGRISFNQGHHKPSFTSRWRRSQDEEDGVGPAAPGRPPIPSALEPKGDLYSTPLPVLSMIVLSIVRTLTLSVRSINQR